MDLTSTYEALSAIPAQDLSFWQDFFMKFYRAFIESSRWQQYIEGVGTTLLVTAMALVLGIVLGIVVAMIRTAHDQQRPGHHNPILFILSLSIGGLLGTVIDLDARFKRLVDKMKKQPRQDDAPRLAQGLSTGILLYCIGTLSILGPINSALLGDHTFLFTNSTLDLVTSAVLAATYGIGMALAAPVLFCWQGSIYCIALYCGNIISPALLCEMSIVGGVLICASGLAILDIKDCKTLNFLPSLLVPVAFFLLRALLGLA